MNVEKERRWNRNKGEVLLLILLTTEAEGDEESAFSIRLQRGMKWIDTGNDEKKEKEKLLKEKGGNQQEGNWPQSKDEKKQNEKKEDEELF